MPGNGNTARPEPPGKHEPLPYLRLVLRDEVSRRHPGWGPWPYPPQRRLTAAGRSIGPDQAKRAALVLFRALESSDAETAAHSVRVTRVALRFARHLGLIFQERATLEITGLLHDLGKIGLAADLLQKPEPLAPEELKDVKRHPWIGKTLVAMMGLKHQKPLILHHHEHWDGRGYPGGLAGEEVPFLCQVLSLADSYDALITDRPYRKGCTPRQALEEIQASAGTQFNPELAGKFIEMLQT
jgi:HD-GYP domain-containing protein (c-di-GMP phosphodiesterase class II)